MASGWTIMQRNRRRMTGGLYFIFIFFFYFLVILLRWRARNERKRSKQPSGDVGCVANCFLMVTRPTNCLTVSFFGFFFFLFAFVSRRSNEKKMAISFTKFSAPQYFKKDWRRAIYQSESLLQLFDFAASFVLFFVFFFLFFFDWPPNVVHLSGSSHVISATSPVVPLLCKGKSVFPLWELFFLMIGLNILTV